MRILGVSPPPNVKNERRKPTGFVSRQAFRIASPDHRNLDLETVLFRQPEPFRETILSQIRQDALRPEARHVEISST